MHDFGTSRLLIRPWTDSDSVAMHAIFSDQEAMRFWDTPLSDGPEAMAGRLGFLFESGPRRGRLRMADGRFADLLTHGLLAADWKDRGP